MDSLSIVCGPLLQHPSYSLHFILRYTYATPLVIVSAFFFYRFSLREIKPFFLSALEPKIIVNTLLIMIFKEVLTYTDVISKLPGLFSSLSHTNLSCFCTDLLLWFHCWGINSNYCTLPSSGLCSHTRWRSCTDDAFNVLLLLCHAGFSHPCMPCAGNGIFPHRNGRFVKTDTSVILIFFLLILLYYQVLTALF